MRRLSCPARTNNQLSTLAEAAGCAPARRNRIIPDIPISNSDSEEAHRASLQVHKLEQDDQAKETGGHYTVNQT